VQAGTTRPTARDLLLVLAVVALWGFNFVPIRWALDEVPPLALASLRFLLAAVPAVLFVKPPRASWWIVAGYGLAIGVGQFGLLFLGLAVGMPAGLASLVAQAQVFFTLGFATLLLGERVTRAQALGTVLAALGIAVLVASRVRAGASATLVGLALTLLAALSWGFGNVLAKLAARRAPPDAPLDMFSLVVWSSLAAPVPLALLSFAFEGGLAPLHAVAGMSVRAWGSTLFMAGGATLFGFAVWNRMLHKHATAVVAPFALLIPIFGLASAWAFLGEELHATELAAAALVLAGLAVNVFGGARAVRPAASRRAEDLGLELEP
jgi:O-acetylserine/cysteine efflux transporter